MHGLSSILASLGALDEPPLVFEADSNPGRVSIVHGGTADVVIDDHGVERSATCQYATALNLSPVAGDWVSTRDDYIVAVTPRRTALTRPATTGRDAQVLAANLDVVLVVMPIDRELNTVMLERLAVMAYDSGARPIVVLTKSDSAAVVGALVAQAEAAVPGVSVMTTSSLSGHGIDELSALLDAGVTAVMLGASGAGKTSLLNALEGTNEETRSLGRSGEGRHATTTRRLYRLRSGGVLLDIPGIRLLDLMIGQEGLDEAFADVVAIGEQCRFADCSHDGDDGCAVEAAVNDGTLAPRRLESWRSIQAEMLERERRREVELAARRRRSRAPKERSSRELDDEDDDEDDEDED